MAAKPIAKSAAITWAAFLLLFACPSHATAGHMTESEGLPALMPGALPQFVFGLGGLEPIPDVAALRRSATRPSAKTGDPVVPPFPILLSKSTSLYIEEFLRQPRALGRCFERGEPFRREMLEALRSRGLPDDLVYLPIAESRFSESGDGPWQFREATGRGYGLKIDSYLDERRDPVLSTRAAADYLSRLHTAAGQDWRVALVGWNVGDSAIRRYWDLRGENYDRLAGSLPAPTRGLLGRFMAVAYLARNAQTYGIASVEGGAAPAYRTVTAKGGTSLLEIARRHRTSLAVLKKLNPALLRDRVPPYVALYRIRIPIGSSRRPDSSTRF